MVVETNLRTSVFTNVTLAWCPFVYPMKVKNCYTPINFYKKNQIKDYYSRVMVWWIPKVIKNNL